VTTGQREEKLAWVHPGVRLGCGRCGYPARHIAGADERGGGADCYIVIQIYCIKEKADFRRKEAEIRCREA